MGELSTHSSRTIGVRLPSRRRILIFAASLPFVNDALAIILKRDSVFRVVCSIRTPKPGGTEDVGTGIFVQKDAQLLLVTASHVARDSNTNTHVILSDDNGNAKSIALSSFGGEFVHHPVADISLLRIAPNDETIGVLRSRFFPFNQVNITRTPPSRDDELTSVGFPTGLGDRGLFSPLTFRSHASSGLITLPRFDTRVPCDFFLMENPSVGGYSGCPVFDLGYVISGNMTTTNTNTICHGIMHGTISDQTGGKLAAVTPTLYLTDIV